MTNINWDLIEYIDYINIKKYEIDNLPCGISISTMCASCKLNTNINIINIEKYFQLNLNDILTIKNNDEKIKTLLPIKSKKKRIRKIENKKDISKNYFYNQITIETRINHDNDHIFKINMKLFKNGSIQMSGCKSINDINIVLNKLIIRLKEIKAIREDNKIIEKNFISNFDINVIDFKIDMINTNYKVNIQIDREKLYNLLLQKKIKASYEPCIRACIIIKYIPPIENIDNKEVSIFIFQKGNIIITGARCKNHILSSYNYINNILINHVNDIIKKDDKEEEDIILNIYQNIIREIDVGLIKI